MSRCAKLEVRETLHEYQSENDLRLMPKRHVASEEDEKPATPFDEQGDSQAGLELLATATLDYPTGLRNPVGARQAAYPRGSDQAFELLDPLVEQYQANRTIGDLHAHLGFIITTTIRVRCSNVGVHASKTSLPG